MSDALTVVLYALLCGVISYLLGSISFAVIFSKAFAKKDVRDSGSGNAGMTNVLRTIGKLPAVLTLICDLAKAVAAIEISKYIFHTLPFNETAMVGAYFGGICVVLGHIFPIFFGFRGGKGVLTCAGVFLVLDWQLCLLSILIFIIIAFATGYVSLGSILAMAAAPISTLIVGFTLRADMLLPRTVIWQTIFLAILASTSIFMHRENIKRLINGTENCFKNKKKGENK
ncbi:MAG: glycerol-3-phosphate 1-O-acyltransferase PlsY [Oscillospiraceae bacterium]|nr:glycerol-3-phosphate 1-O-acyltransferase PlsY [Oscillospiraceae bacterium]MBQ5815889.1 glycerol-3-phosphate 1-O-acyltransferase PlsY [Oscillospiraceae bacterium]